MERVRIEAVAVGFALGVEHHGAELVGGDLALRPRREEPRLEEEAGENVDDDLGRVLEEVLERVGLAGLGEGGDGALVDQVFRED